MKISNLGISKIQRIDGCRVDVSKEEFEKLKKGEDPFNDCKWMVDDALRDAKPKYHYDTENLKVNLVEFDSPEEADNIPEPPKPEMIHLNLTFKQIQETTKSILVTEEEFDQIKTDPTNYDFDQYIDDHDYMDMENNDAEYEYTIRDSYGTKIMTISNF